MALTMHAHRGRRITLVHTSRSVRGVTLEGEGEGIRISSIAAVQARSLAGCCGRPVS